MSRLIEEIKKKNSWGKNELLQLIAEKSAEIIDEAAEKSNQDLAASTNLDHHRQQVSNDDLPW